MTEVGGAAATYFDPDHLEEAAQIISSALNEKNLRERSLMNASRFNLYQMIEGYLAAYSTAIGSRDGIYRVHTDARFGDRQL